MGESCARAARECKPQECASASSNRGTTTPAPQNIQKLKQSLRVVSSVTRKFHSSSVYGGAITSHHIRPKARNQKSEAERVYINCTCPEAGGSFIRRRYCRARTRRSSPLGVIRNSDPRQNRAGFVPGKIEIGRIVARPRECDAARLGSSDRAFQNISAGTFEDGFSVINIEGHEIRHLAPIEAPDRKRSRRRRMTAHRHRKKYQAKTPHRFRLRARGRSGLAHPKGELIPYRIKAG